MVRAFAEPTTRLLIRCGLIADPAAKTGVHAELKRSRRGEWRLVRSRIRLSCGMIVFKCRASFVAPRQSIGSTVRHIRLLTLLDNHCLTSRYALTLKLVHLAGAEHHAGNVTLNEIDGIERRSNVGSAAVVARSTGLQPEMTEPDTYSGAS
jgi:hypothetical protein